MGGLPTMSVWHPQWLLGVALAGTGCDDFGDKKPVSAPLERSQVVAAKASPSSMSSPIASSKGVASAARKPARSLCGGQLSTPGKPAPKKPVSQAAAPGEQPLPEHMALSGAYTWLNFWAAWCGPCKEEIPRLLRFETELAKSFPGFRVSFVSLDDDERQLNGFLAEQPANPAGLRRSYWLTEGKQREDWLKATELEADPELPFHLLFDPKGKLRCVVKGALEDADLPALRELLAR
jgi:thiol-disulfide isomerase/thioredoxin